MVAFMKAFYEWMEEEGPDLKSRQLLEYRDIDLTEEDYLSHWVKKYMPGIPVERLGDKRFLQKHILDVYRSKGSVEGLRVLFRLLYDEEIDYYIPSRDMLAPSDGIWNAPRYLEVSYTPFNSSFYGRRLTGAVSGATALVEDYVTRIVKGRLINVFYLSNIVGDFQVFEPVTYEGLEQFVAPIIYGSAGGVTVISGPEGSSIGDKYKAYDEFGNGLGLEVRVNDIEPFGSGSVEFSITFGGFGYTLGADVDVLSGGLQDQEGDFLKTEADEYIDFIFVGSGAAFTIDEISNVQTIFYGTTIIDPYELDTLSDATFLYNPIINTETDTGITAEDGYFLLSDGTGGIINDDVTISDWEDISSFQGGTISRITTTLPGSDYTSDVTVIVVEPAALELQVDDGLGGFYGDDAVIQGAVVAGTDVATGVKLFDSGFGYFFGDAVNLYFSEDNTITDSSGDDLTTEAGDVLFHDTTDLDGTIAGTVTRQAVGYGAGYWSDTKGQLNADKYIQDSFYYQEYSYEVRASRSLNQYEDIVKSVYHPAGVELFGLAVMNSLNDVPDEIASTITSS
jgi:hypothetical protein